MNINSFKYPICVAAAWALNPWLGFIASALWLPQKKSDYFIIGVLALLTVVLYQLNLPLPFDLDHTKKIYGYITLYPEYAVAWIKRDFLSYGSLYLLSFFVPGVPITFYILNMLLNFVGLTLVFKKLCRDDGGSTINLSLCLALSLGVLDHQLSHHYLRQTTGFVLFLSSLYMTGKPRFFLATVGILWHGSNLIFVPVFFLRKLVRRSKKFLLCYGTLLFAAAFLCRLNVYSFFDHKPTLDFLIFEIHDRFLTYFTNKHHETFFSHSLENGNSMAWIFSVFFLVTLAQAYVRRHWRRLETSLVLYAWPLLVLFQHHQIIFERLAYTSQIILFFYWSCQVRYLKPDRFVPLLVLLIVFLRFTFFLWPVDTLIEDLSLYLNSPLTLMLRFKLWPMNL